MRVRAPDGTFHSVFVLCVCVYARTVLCLLGSGTIALAVDRLKRSDVCVGGSRWILDLALSEGVLVAGASICTDRGISIH